MNSLIFPGALPEHPTGLYWVLIWINDGTRCFYKSTMC